MMKVFLLYLGLAFLALFIQSAVFAGTKPDFVLLLVCFYSLLACRQTGRYGEVKGMLYGASAGLLIDSASGMIIGPNIMSKSIIGFLMSFTRHQFFEWNGVLNTAAVVIFSVADILIVSLCLEGFTGISFGLRPWKISILQVIYTMIFGVVVYQLLNRKKDKMNSERIPRSLLRG